MTNTKVLNNIALCGRVVGEGHRPFVIAEMSGNHNQSLARALEIVEAAHKAGADAVKLQTYTADTMTINSNKSDFIISDPSSPWFGRSLYGLYEEAYTPWEWHEPIFSRCKELGIGCFSTPFDGSSVDFLMGLNVPVIKVASFENTDTELLRKIGQTKKPVIMSTGMASLAELEVAISTLRSSGCSELILLKCTSSYPASPAESNLRTIPHLRQLFSTPVGLSDHTMGVGAAIAAVALGACVIEKHFTLSRADGGVDSAFSLEPVELAGLVVECERAWQALGRVSYEPTKGEVKSRQLRRSLYVIRDLKKGETVLREHLQALRPSLGIEVANMDLVVGKKATQDITAGSPLCWEHLMRI